MTIKLVARLFSLAFAVILTAGALCIAKAQTSSQNADVKHDNELGSSARLSTAQTSASRFVGDSASKKIGRTSFLFGTGNQGCNPATTGSNNACYGVDAGKTNTTGSRNAFFGRSAGNDNAEGKDNAFFGYLAGISNTDGFDNSYFGSGAGVTNKVGSRNTFFGSRAGAVNISSDNAFFGSNAGNDNTAGSNNAFFGSSAGAANKIGQGNSFFGDSAGAANTEGYANAFFGDSAGAANTKGGVNAFFGHFAGIANTEGSNNVFIGYEAGKSNTDESKNTFIGSSSNGLAGITNATAIGADALVKQSDSLVLGSVKGVNGAAADTKGGIGTSAPQAKLHVEDGDIYVGGDVYIKTQNKGIILQATDGKNCFRVTVNDAGTLSATKVRCP